MRAKVREETFQIDIAREMISNNEGQTSYTMRVENFKQKMKTWMPVREICSNIFEVVDGVNLRILLYPNGITQSDMCGLLFICNESDVAFLFDDHVGSKKFDDLPEFHIRAGHKTAIRLVNHSRDKDEDDAAFEIIVTIQKLWKQVVLFGQHRVARIESLIS